MVFDLNGLLLHRNFTRTKLHIQCRPDVTVFLNWLCLKVDIVFWSTVMPKNMDHLLDVLLADTSFGPQDVTCLIEGACTKLRYRAPFASDKPIFLKDLGTFA